MTDPVTLERHGSVALIVIHNPPVNAIAQPVRAGLLRAIEEADAHVSFRAIVLHGAGKGFIAGADIRELDSPAREPLLNDVLLRLESCNKPVIAALHGAVLGGGFEVALAAHYRCAAQDVQLGFPEVKLGLLPGSGGTQRLPRIVGVQTALDLMVTGKTIDRARARTLGIVDREVETDNLLPMALAYADELIAAKAPPRRLRDKPIPDAAAADAKFFDNYRAALPASARRIEAVDRIIQCVEAAVSLQFDAALARSRVLFEACRASGQSAALRHLFLAERGASKGADARRVERICVIGAGTMGAGIAVSCAQNGYDVTLIDADTTALESGLGRIRSTFDTSVAKRRLTSAEGEAARARVTGATEIASARDADLVIEAVFENLAVKQDVFRQLDAVCRGGAILATNTSTLDVAAIASVTRRAADVVGMHFFSPAHVMRLVEIVRASETSAVSVATAVAVTRRIGKIGVVVGNGFGFVGNRMFYAYGQQNQQLLLEGATPQRIDSVLEEWGMALGPSAVGDLAGLDVGYRARREWADRPDDPAYFRASDLLVEQGRLGQKNGRGFYRYEPGGRERQPDAEVAGLIRAEAQRLGIVQRAIPDAEIIARCIHALVNEGARLLEEGIAASPADIDVIWCNGYGFPRPRGGPMFYADSVGLLSIYDSVRGFEAQPGGQYWAPAPLLERLALNGKTFKEWQT
jgi:3-hydroxyacyl-CoA dehydrogenase